MAKLDRLIGEISDADVRERIGEAVEKLRSTKRFGLVFEDFIPETISLPSLPVEPGSLVQLRSDVTRGTRFRVARIEDGEAFAEPVEAQKARLRTELAGWPQPPAPLPPGSRNEGRTWLDPTPCLRSRGTS